MAEIISSPLLWIILGIVLFFLEFMIPGLVVAFFGLGAWITALTTWLKLTNSIGAQLIVFLVSSILTLIILRRLLKRYFYGDIFGKMGPGDKLDDVAGEIVEVKKKIMPNKKGKVKFHGSLWDAISDEEIEVGEDAKIIDRTNITLKVKKIES